MPISGSNLCFKDADEKATVTNHSEYPRKENYMKLNFHFAVIQWQMDQKKNILMGEVVDQIKYYPSTRAI